MCIKATKHLTIEIPLQNLDRLAVALEIPPVTEKESGHIYLKSDGDCYYSLVELLQEALDKMYRNLLVSGVPMKDIP